MLLGPLLLTYVCSMHPQGVEGDRERDRVGEREDLLKGAAAAAAKVTL